ncbi:SPOR domain-containing protein [Acinetobacter qingfengensis]|uniref:Cell division protein n=1 Tax=Acinetobacter qingfengensis TaxID=1262585 RepID=A0A1E7REC1_9GAMM|nr:SPOR domain-containing protein [Acinetobacter qingfengensis]KAA8733679.1 SPOR domain-containing protein [Acinetobacter qingfengensis]OEY97505.1 cell division protein [Acinetobacter qingfengensis]
MFGKTQRGVSERPKPAKTNKTVPSWLWLFVLILMGVCVAIFLSLWQPWQPVAKADPNANLNAEQETNKDYRFYDMLPKQQVTPIPEQAVPEHQTQQPVTVIEAPGSQDNIANHGENDETGEKTPVTPRYILQIKSYQDPDSADAKRAEIVLNGLSADVIMTNEGNKIWYRVISGPYPSQQAAGIAQQTLQNGGIDSIIVKQAGS